MFQDVVILNKVDMISTENVEDLEKEILGINSMVDIIRSVRCQVDLSQILERHAYDAKVSQFYLHISLL